MRLKPNFNQLQFFRQWKSDQWYLNEPWPSLLNDFPRYNFIIQFQFPAFSMQFRIFLLWSSSFVRDYGNVAGPWGNPPLMSHRNQNVTRTYFHHESSFWARGGKLITINNVERQVLGSEPLRWANINSVSETYLNWWLLLAKWRSLSWSDL